MDSWFEMMNKCIIADGGFVKKLVNLQVSRVRQLRLQTYWTLLEQARVAYQMKLQFVFFLTLAISQKWQNWLETPVVRTGRTICVYIMYALSPTCFNKVPNKLLNYLNVGTKQSAEETWNILILLKEILSLHGWIEWSIPSSFTKLIKFPS